MKRPGPSPSTAAVRRQIVARDTFLERVAEGLDARVATLRGVLGDTLAEPARTALEALSGFSRELGLIARPGVAVLGEGRSALDLSGAVQRLVDAHRDRLAGRELRLSASGPVLVACAADDVETVFLELLTNAAKYGNGPIAVRVDAGKARARLTIRDEGAGVPPRLRRAVLARFVRHPGARPRTGFGVGLWLVRKIARGYGGDLRIGKDATFSVTFRLAPAGPGRGFGGGAPISTAGSPPSGPPARLA